MGFAPRADAFVPLQQVTVEQFEIEFSSSRGYRSSELANFTYVDGAYRYLGRAHIRSGLCRMPPRRKNLKP